MKFETTKLVNIYPTYPIVTITPPIRCPIKNVRKTIPEIRECIIKRAVVEEILEDGSIVNLDFANYDKDNTKKGSIEDLFKKEEKKEFVKPSIEQITKPIEEPIIEESIETPVEEAVVEETIETSVEEAVVEEPTAEAEEVVESEEAVSEDDQYGL